MAEEVILTKEGKEELEKRLEYLKITKRKEITERIKTAREFGDLSENAEYDAAKEAQGLLEARISKLQDLIANARLLDESKLDTSKVLLLSIIEIRNTKTKLKQRFHIVPESEADVKKGKISVSSPFAKAFLGKQQGDIVEVSVPAGIMNFEILSVER